MTHLSTHIVVDGAEKAAAWYAINFGAVEVGRIPVPGGKFMQIEMRFGEDTVMIADEFPAMGVRGPKSLGGSPFAFHLLTDDVDEAYSRVIKDGATAAQEPADMFWGERFVQIIDPFGHRWNLAKRIRDVSMKEIASAAWVAFGGAPTK